MARNGETKLKNRLGFADDVWHWLKMLLASNFASRVD